MRYWSTRTAVIRIASMLEIKGDPPSTSLNGIFTRSLLKVTEHRTVGAADRVVDLSASSTIGSKWFFSYHKRMRAGDCTRDYGCYPQQHVFQISELFDRGEWDELRWALDSRVPPRRLVEGTDYDSWTMTELLMDLPGDAVIIDGIGNME